MERRVRAFGSLVAHLDGSDTLLCIENTPSTPSLEEILEIIEAVRSPRMAVCLDTGHANIDGVDMVAFIAKSGPLLQALHIHDNDGRSDQHLIPGNKGTIQWDEVVAALTRARYAGLFSFEIPGETDCPMPVRLAKLRALKRILPALLEGEGSYTSK